MSAIPVSEGELRRGLNPDAGRQVVKREVLGVHGHDCPGAGELRCRHDVQASQGLHWRTPPNSLNLRDFLRHSQGRLGYRTAWMIKAKVSATQELQVNIDSHERC